MAKTKNTHPKKKKASVVKQAKPRSPNARVRQKPQYKSFRLHKRIKHHAPPLPSWWDLLRMAFRLMRHNIRAITVFTLVYGVLNLVFVRGFESPIDVEGIQLLFDDLFGGDYSRLALGVTALSIFAESSTTAVSELAQLYQSILLIIGSLAIIWLYRQQQAGNDVTMKMAFYRGMYPLVPFILVIGIMGLQAVPALVGNFLFSTVMTGGLAVNQFEEVVWLLLLLSTLLISFYMLSSSIFALYIVTLPEMTPMMAVRKARELVRFRAVPVLLRVFAIVLIVFMILVIVVLPIIFYAPALAQWIFFLITVLAVPLVHAYLYSLYRELL